MEGLIYRLYNETDNYIGSTTKLISQRLEEHEICYGLWSLNYFQEGYLSSFEVLKSKNYKIEIIEENIGEKYLIDQEKFYINNVDCVNIQFNRTKKTKSKKERFLEHSQYDLSYFIEKARRYIKITGSSKLSYDGYLKYSNNSIDLSSLPNIVYPWQRFVDMEF